jgi:SAM-dependent methyltransferase
LKLSPIVGTRGAVLAVDIRRESLAFLWIRRFTRNARNVRVIRGETDDPQLPPVPVDAVLIANTYHELDRPTAILSLMLRAMTSGGRLVVVNRGPRMNDDGTRDASTTRHELRPRAAADEIEQAGSEVVTRDDRFIDRSAMTTSGGSSSPESLEAAQGPPWRGRALVSAARLAKPPYPKHVVGFMDGWIALLSCCAIRSPLKIDERRRTATHLR